MSDILKAFLEQSGIDPDCPSQSKAFEELQYELEAHADTEAMKMAQEMMLDKRRNSISTHIQIPTQITHKDIEGKAEAHPRLSGYDHGLEQDRWKGKRGFAPRAGEEADYPVGEDGVMHIDL